MNAAAAPERRSGLSVVRDVVIAPQSAFESLREQPQWLWAFVVTCALGMVAWALQLPADEHIATVAHRALATQRWIWIYPPFVLLAVALVSVVMLAGSTLARGSANFARLFALAANVAVVGFGLGRLVVGTLSRFRRPDEFSSQTDLLKLVPSLAWLLPDAPSRVEAFLTHVNPFGIWSFILLAMGLQTVATLKPAAAYTIAAFIEVGSATIAAALSR